MPTYLDLHTGLESATTEDVLAAHAADLELQEKYGARYLTYWFNKAAGKVFCLVEAPSAEFAATVHREAHGLLAEKIIEVDREMLGAMMDVRPELFPNGVFAPDTGEADTAFRTIMFTDIVDSTPMTSRLGDEGAMDMVRTHDRIIRSALERHTGSHVKHTGDGIMASFKSAQKALECAIEIQRAFAQHAQDHPGEELRIRIGLSAGEPVAQDNDLFGIAVNLARRACDAAAGGQIYTSNVVGELCAGKPTLRFESLGPVPLKGFVEPVHLYAVPWL
jgi:class 3 adenylate cyclase